MRDQIVLEGLRFYGYHGVHPEERVRGQRFLVDILLEADLRKAGQTDDLRNTVNYSAVYSAVKGVVEGDPKELVEAVAEQVAAEILEQFENVESVEVTVRKPEVSIRGAHLDAVGVRIKRSRPRTTPLQRREVPRPRPLPR